MAFFLLLYVLAVIVWFAWAAILTYHAIKYRFPKDNSKFYLIAFLAASALILIVSIMFISGADWMTVPPIFKSL